MYLCQYCFVYIYIQSCYIHRVAPFFPTFSNQLYWTMFDYTFGFGYRFGQMPVHCWFATPFFFFWLHFPFILGYTAIFPQFSPFNCHLSPGWWFQTFLICHNIWDVILLIDFHIGWSTSQSLLFFLIGWSTNTLCAVASCRRQTCMFRRSRFCWTPTSGSTAWKAQRT